MKRDRTAWLPQTREAAATLGLLVAQGRRHRRWTARELAERTGVTVKTLRKVEAGDPSVALGTALDAAALVGVPLFAEPERLADVRSREADRLALLPRRVRVSDEEVDDDF